MRVDDPGNSVTNLDFVEVEEQAERKISGPQVRQQLGAVDINYALDGFEFQNDETLNHHVDPQIADLDRLVAEPDRSLPIDAKVTLLKFVGQGILVEPFKKSGSEVGVYFDGRGDDLPRHVVPRLRD